MNCLCIFRQQKPEFPEYERLLREEQEFERLLEEARERDRLQYDKKHVFIESGDSNFSILSEDQENQVCYPHLHIRLCDAILD